MLILLLNKHVREVCNVLCSVSCKGQFNVYSLIRHPGSRWNNIQRDFVTVDSVDH